MENPRVSDAVSVPTAVATVQSNAPIADALRTMRSEGIHHLVVRDQGAVIGVVSDRDIFDRGTAFDGITLRPSLHVSDVMIRLKQFATATMSLRDAVALLADSGASALPVFGARGLVGIITESDLLHVLGLLLTPSHNAGESRATGGAVVLSNPLIQEAMRLLSEAGV